MTTLAKFILGLCLFLITQPTHTSAAKGSTPTKNTTEITEDFNTPGAQKMLCKKDKTLHLKKEYQKVRKFTRNATEHPEVRTAHKLH